MPKGVVELLASSFYKESSAGVLTMRFGLFYGYPIASCGVFGGRGMLGL